MPFFIPNKTTCKICNDLIQTSKESLVLDYMDVSHYADLAPFVKSFVHRSCFINWNMKERYTTAAFELVENAVKRGDIHHSIYLKSRLLILEFDEWISVKDFLIVFEIEIPKHEISTFSNLVTDLIGKKITAFDFKNWKFELIDEQQILVKTYSMDEICDEFIITKDRLEEIALAIQLAS